MKHIIPEAALGQHIAVLGKTRSGKSSVMRGLVEGLLEREQPVCIVDPKGDWWGIKLARDGKRPGYPVVIFGGEHADVPINAHAGAHVAELFATGNRPCLIDLGGWMVGDRTRFWIDFASNLFKHTKGMRWLVVDEVHNFAPKGKIMDPDAGKALHWGNRLASEGLGKGVHMIFASQRPQKVHNDTLTSAETLIAMRVLHPSDRGAVSDWIKGCGDLELGNKVLNSLADMKRGEGWAWSPEIGFGPERVQFPMFKTYDSFRPQSAEEAQALKGWAEVDLDEVKAKLAKVVQEAEANDPAKLRATIARLQADLMKKGDGEIDQKVIDVARGQGYVQGGRDAYEHLLGQLRPLADRLVTMADGVSETVRGCQADLTRLASGKPPVKHSDQFAETRSSAVTPPARSAQRATSGPLESEVSRPQQRILDGLAWLKALGIDRADRVRAAMLADQSPRSSGYEKNVSTLKTLGLVSYPSQGELALTREGEVVAAAPDVPATDEALHDAIRRHLSGPQWKLLEVLIHAYPKAYSREELATRAHASALSSGFEKNVSTLRSLGFIDYPEQGHVAALPVLFVESR